MADRDVSEMTTEEIEKEYDALPRSFENMDDYKVAKSRRTELAQEFNRRTYLAPDLKGPGHTSRRVLSES
jgi:hypothetical protein